MNTSAYPISSIMINASLEDVRRSITFHPTVWGDHFLAYASDATEISEAEEQELERLKERVKHMLADTPDDSFHKLELIDTIERLGLGYHFENEIDASLINFCGGSYLVRKHNDDDLRIVSLCFRLLRQHGCNLSSNVFNKFVDDQGKFESSLGDDIEGMLSLYEAAHFGVDGEDVLDKALEFSSSRLQSSLHEMPRSLATKVSEALKIPLSKSLNRLAAKKFISMYKEDGSHDPLMLNLAKLDFNVLQKMHQKELSSITRWWKDLDFANRLPFARDRLVESYFWTLTLHFEPRFHVARKYLVKVLCITSIIDDIYDVYGTLDDLLLFTNAIQSWDFDVSEKLPPYMRTCYKALLDVYAEMEEEIGNTGLAYCVQYAINEVKKMVKAYMEEAEWFYDKHTPTMESYMKVALVSCGYLMLSITSFVGMGDLATTETYEWVASNPRIVQASSIICRLMDDMVGYGHESKITAVECYVKQNDASKEEAFADFWEQVKKAWKDMNEECLVQTKAFPLRVLMNVVNLARVINLLYVDEDGYTNSKTMTKYFINYVLVEPVTI